LWFAERPSCCVWCVAMVTRSVMLLVASSGRADVMLHRATHALTKP